MKINLLVIRTENPEILKEQYEKIGLKFEYHRHGNGPMHYSFEKDGFVFEIYPSRNIIGKKEDRIRLGFELKNLDLKIHELKNTNWKIISEVKETKWGRIAIIEDLDGRKIELKDL